MEALIRAPSAECHSSSLVLSLSQVHLPHLTTAKQRARFSQKGGSANALVTLPSRTFTNTQTRKPIPPCYCSAASSTSVADQRLVFALAVGSAIIPHPAKVEKGGEDAFFVSSHNGGVLGVADGVSGWAEENVDPALFSRELMEHVITALDNEVVGTCPRQLLAKAHEATSAIGAATAIVAILEKEVGILHVANLGDCGLRVVRGGKIVFATSTQQHYFDCPYQLSSEAGAQTSKDAMVYKIELLPGDIVVMGSDGLFDNVFDKDIEGIINVCGGSDGDLPQRIASALASLASKHSRDIKYESPYSQEAILQGYDLPLWKRLLGQKLTGGKLDDITVLTAHVVVSLALPKEPPAEVVQEEALPLPVEMVQEEAPPLPVETVQEEASPLPKEPPVEVVQEEAPPLPVETVQEEASPLPVEETDSNFVANQPLAPAV